MRARPGYFAPKPPPVRPTHRVHGDRTEPGSSLDMSIDELEVVEDGVPQKVETFQEATTPVSIVFALDASGSMKKAASRSRRPRAGFVEQVRPEDSLATDDCSADKVQLRARPHDATATGASTPSTSTSPTAARRSTTRCTTRCPRLKGIEGRRVVVVMTDGRDENNPGTAPGSVAHVRAGAGPAARRRTPSSSPSGSARRSIARCSSSSPHARAARPISPRTSRCSATDFNRIVENLRRRT